MIASRIGSTLLTLVLLSTGIVQGVDNRNTLMTKITYENECSVESCVIEDTKKQVIAATAIVVPGVKSELSEDEVGKKVAKLEVTYPTQQLVKIAKSCSAEIPLKVQIELPTKIIGNYIKDININQITIDVIMPNDLKKENIKIEKIILSKNIINLSTENNKPLSIRIMEENGIEQSSRSEERRVGKEC